MSGYTVLRGDEHTFAAPSWSPSETGRELVEVRNAVGNRRHREPVQEEVFCVLEGTLTAYLGEQPERLELPPRTVVVVEPGTPLQLRNESDADVLFFAYGAPAQSAGDVAEKLPDAYLP